MRNRDWTDGGDGPPLVHRLPGREGEPKKSVEVRSRRLVPADRSRYSGAALREIRRSEFNFSGEVRR